MIENSIVQLQLPKDPNHPLNKLDYENNINSVSIGRMNASHNHDKNQMEIVDKMIQLVERIEKEGDVYVELRSKLRSQIATIYHNENQKNDTTSTSSSTFSYDSSNNSNHDEYDEDTDGDIDSSNDATERTKVQWLTTQFTSTYGATPGPSTSMYDLTLDAIANTISKTSNPILYLYKARKLYLNALERNELDCKQKFDGINIKSNPTAATFNTLIRISSCVDIRRKEINGDEEVRDVAVANAFMGFDSVHHHHVVQRNSATFHYLIQTVNKFFPDCDSKGYILVTLWDKCKSEGVLNENIIKSMLEVNSKDCGGKFHAWMVKDIRDVYDPKEKNGFGFPLKYSKNKNLKRFDKRLDVY